MSRRLSVTLERFPLAASFTISRGSKTEAVVVVCTVEDEYGRGWGECVPYARYAETAESVCAALEGVRAAVEGGASRATIQTLLPAGAARNALDCALWDIEAKSTNRRVEDMTCRFPARPVETAYTISLGTPADMGDAARAVANRGVLKIKVGGQNDGERMRAVRSAARSAKLIIDANEGWTADNIVENMLVAASINATVIEQPLPSGDDSILAEIPHPVPICADESVHATKDLAALRDRYDYVNLKLDKTGGLTEGKLFLAEARRLGFGVMVGCMVGSSLSMAPAVLLAQYADLVDLDGPLLLRADREHGLLYSSSTVSPPRAALWG